LYCFVVVSCGKNCEILDRLGRFLPLPSRPFGTLPNSRGNTYLYLFQ
jgi:hypothetical protein